MKGCAIVLTFFIFKGLVCASPRVSPQTRLQQTLLPFPTAFTVVASPGADTLDEVKKRQTTSGPTTCGYDNGDPTKPRTAAAGWACRVDTSHGLWGFCPATVIAATDCGLAGHCIDNSGCSGGCGVPGASSLTTFSCSAAGSEFCSTALLIDGPDLTYSYIACAPNSGVQRLLVQPTAAVASTTVAVSTTKAPSSTASSTTTSSSASSSSSSTQKSSSAPASSSASASESSSTSSSTAQTTSPPPAVTLNTPSETGPIVGGVLGGLALIGFFGLAALFLVRKYRRAHPLNGAATHVPPPRYEGGRDDPKFLADGYNRRTGGYGPSELPSKTEPHELWSRYEPAELGG